MRPTRRALFADRGMHVDLHVTGGAAFTSFDSFWAKTTSAGGGGLPGSFSAASSPAFSGPRSSQDHDESQSQEVTRRGAGLLPPPMGGAERPLKAASRGDCCPPQSRHPKHKSAPPSEGAQPFDAQVLTALVKDLHQNVRALEQRQAHFEATVAEQIAEKLRPMIVHASTAEGWAAGTTSTPSSDVASIPQPKALPVAPTSAASPAPCRAPPLDVPTRHKQLCDDSQRPRVPDARTDREPPSDDECSSDEISLEDLLHNRWADSDMRRGREGRRAPSRRRSRSREKENEDEMDSAAGFELFKPAANHAKAEAAAPDESEEESESAVPVAATRRGGDPPMTCAPESFSQHAESRTVRQQPRWPLEDAVWHRRVSESEYWKA